ncbi:MAG: regulator of cell morphosis and signaling [Bacteroidales bacterium]|jgi:regulator of cell morphogenesis and NO signaling|nr:regulator of cell morphosis and signaling [Bacteroidales bacterium]MDN5329531.1 regulator of cell morphosis and signaling [Bacteroidales bacterium]
MHPFNRLQITPNDKLISLIEANPYILLLIEYFRLPLIVGNHTVNSFCKENGINPTLFISIGSLYFRLPVPAGVTFSSHDLPWIVKFLKNSHQYYLNEKYLEVLRNIHEMYEANPAPEMAMVEKFFEDYMSEVREHLEYEEKAAFPYFLSLVEKSSGIQPSFSAKVYLDHHSDIETKLSDLKQLLLVHLPVSGDYKARRRTIQSLMELEFDINVHTNVEEQILVPLVIAIEKQRE